MQLRDHFLPVSQADLNSCTANFGYEKFIRYHLSTPTQSLILCYSNSFYLNRMQHASLSGASTWITAGVGGSHEFSEIYLEGNAHLAFDYGATESQASIVAGNIVGDKTGLHELLAYST